MDIIEFERIEKLKAYFRGQLVNEIYNKIGLLRYADNDVPRNAVTRQAEDHGYHHGLAQVQELLKTL